MLRNINQRLFLLTALAIGLAALGYHSGIWHSASSESYVSASDSIPVYAEMQAQSKPLIDKSERLANNRKFSPFATVDPTANASAAASTPELPVKSADTNQIRDRVLALLSQITSYGSTGIHERWDTVRTDIVKLIEKNPELVEALLDQYPDTSTDIEKSLLKDIFQFANHDLLEDKIVEKVVQERPEQTALWLDLTRSMGVVHADNQEKVLERLASLDEPGQIRNAVGALVPDSALSVSNQLVIDMLQPLYDHPDETVRLSVVRKMGEWAGPEHAYLVERILNNPSVSVQDAGLQSLFTSGLRSERIKASLLTLIQNDRADWNLRRSAFFALGDYSLHGSERDAFFQFKQKMNSPPPVLGEG